MKVLDIVVGQNSLLSKNKYFLSDTAATSINKTEDATKSNLCLGPQMGLTTLTRGNATVICKYIFSFIPNLFRTSRLLQYLGLFRCVSSTCFYLPFCRFYVIATVNFSGF